MNGKGKMKIKVVIIFGLFATTGFAQYGRMTEGDKIARAAQAELEKQNAVYREKAFNDAILAEIQSAQQAELNLIFSKDPWRNINNVTNCTTGAGWLEFQGQAQAVMPDGVVFKGKFGPVLTVHTDPSYSDHLVTRITKSSQANRTNGSTSKSFQSVVDAGYERQAVYGDDYFFVKNFAYPADTRQGYEEMMAFPDGYYSYTSPSGQTLTIKSFDYGKPCVKVWSTEEIAAAQQKADQKKKSVQDRTLKFNQDAAAKGDAYGLLRMGQRYRDGDGVEKDMAKARDYLTRAADAGSPTAAEELKQLP